MQADTSVYNCIQMDTTYTDNDNENENVNVNVNDNKNVNVNKDENVQQVLRKGESAWRYHI